MIPVFRTPLQPETRVNVNSVARLECFIDAYPPPKISWHVNGTEIKPSTKYFIGLEGTKSVLEVRNVTNEDMGTYTCKAYSDIGEAVTSTTLYVIGEYKKPKS